MEKWWEKYMYIPFEEKGRTETGADCWGLGKIIYEKELGIMLPSFDDLYDNTIHRPSVSKTIEEVQQSMFKTVDTPEPFDFIILRIFGLPMHIGIVTKPNYMIHCSKDIGVCHEKFTERRWNDKVLGFARYEQPRNTDLCKS